ncbi:porin [Massilia horti]|uniref:Porin n=1 Tax=Massilia horti TaxID=2562153 RepID=A0A4Y9TAU3_9BURK|nr:porin [Massilia horti]
MSACLGLALASAWISTPVTAWAQDQAPGADPPPALQPPLATLTPNPKPARFNVGEVGPIYATGVLSGFAQLQSNHLPADHRWRFDINNGQVFLNKPDGLIQFFLQFGYYSLPALGTPYLPAGDATPAFYTPIPQGYLKIAPNENFSVMVGKLPTVIGAETTFTYQNMNVERGLLWNQENAVNRGVQVNYAQGPLSLAFSVNDGFYSGHLSWITGSASYAFDKSNTLAFVGGGNTSHTGVSSTRTPLFQNNQQIYNLIYTHTEGPWVLQPYLQYTHVPRLEQFGARDSASTYGAALLVSYDFGSGDVPAAVRTPGFKLAGRLEYINSTGSIASGAPNLLYGPGSAAWSLTVTPTYQYQNYFVRGELSYVGASDTTPGAAFGADGNKGSQVRGLIELGVLF